MSNRRNIKKAAERSAPNLKMRVRDLIAVGRKTTGRKRDARRQQR